MSSNKPILYSKKSKTLHKNTESKKEIVPVKKSSSKTIVIQPPEIKHRVLDEILEGPQGGLVSDKLEPTLHTQVSNRIFQEIMTKIKIRRVDVEEVKPTAKREEKEPRGKPSKSISESIISKIANLLKDAKSGVEIEASFGIFSKTFQPGLKSTTDFTNLMHFLSTNEFFESTPSEDVVEIQPSPQGTIRCITSISPSGKEKKVWETKQRDKGCVVEIPEYGVRITKSLETKKEKPVDAKLWKPTLRRIRNRVRFSFREYSEIKAFVIELTRVQETPLRWEGENVTAGKTFIKNEVEIELVDTSVVTDEESALNLAKNFADVIEDIYRTSVSNLVPMEADDLDSDPFTFTMKDRAYVANIHNNLFENDIKRVKDYFTPNAYSMYDKNYWNKPINIKMKHLLPGDNEFHLKDAPTAVKHNGKRFCMLLANGICWLVWAPYTIIKFGTYQSSLDMSLLDGELKTSEDDEGNLTSYTYYVFDVMFYKNKDIRYYKFADRLKLIQEFVDNIEPYHGVIKSQTYFTEGTLYDRIKAANASFTRMIKDDPDSADGIIIQSPFKYYGGLNKGNEVNKFMTYKWKPADQLTIDFKIVRAPKELIADPDFPRIAKKNIDRAYIIKVKKGQILEPFIRTHGDVKYAGDIILSAKQAKIWDNSKLDGHIVECKWDSKNTQFIPIRIREDKPHPNNFDTAKDVWDDIQNPINISTLAGEDLVLMRKYHNQVKSALLSKYVYEGAIILDIGSGRGGDIGKWRANKLKRVYASEPSFNEKNTDAFSIDTRNEFNKRLSEQLNLPNQPDVKQIKYGVQKTQQIVKAIKKDKLSAGVAFFSLTFLAESQEKFDSFIETIDKVIPPKGKFVGIVMDGHRVNEILEKATKVQAMSKEELKDKIRSLRDSKFVLDSNLNIDEDPDYILEQRLSRDSDNYTPYEEGTPMVFKTKPFEISQSGDYGFDMTDPFSNQITITIHDQTSMVDYVEWLFNYEHFRDRMIEIGFKEIETYFLDDGPAKNLPKDGYIFSALNRVFAFERKG